MSSSISYGVPAHRLLVEKTAVVYGAGGGVGSAIAKAFSREGATVFLAGRTLSSLDMVAREISKAGGSASVSRVDALDQKSVDEHLHDVVTRTGKVDVSFNLIGTDVGMGSSLTELSEEQFTHAAFSRVRSYFITMTAAARIMEKQGSGVILGLTAPNARLPRPNMGGFSVGGAAIEALCRQLAFEVGPKGVRVVCLRTGGTPDNPVLHEVFSRLAELKGTTAEAIADSEAQITALKRLPLLPEVANAAVLLASDYATTITATTANASCGELVD
jgi:NAD(P)-dependent dehydrogenase (short-subunit alcohol dehydrogenase family)